MRKQRGVTMIGWIFLLVPMAIVIYAGIRVGPEYYEYYKLVSAMKETAKELEASSSVNPKLILGSLQKRFDTGYIDKHAAETIEVKRGDTGGWDMVADYESEVPLFGNLSLSIAFEKTINIASGDTGQ